MLTKALQITVTKPSWRKREYVFYHNRTRVGNITFTKNFKLEASAIFNEEEWTVNRSGFWKSILHYKAAHRPYTKGKVQQLWSGKVPFSSVDGNVYTFKRLKWYKTNWGWYDQNDKPLLELRPNYSITSNHAEIIIHQTSHPEIWLLTTMAWFVYILQKRQAAAVAS
jgi:hypothetical protein